MLTACIRLQNIINVFDGKRTLAGCTKMTLLPSVQSYCFQLLNTIQVCDVLVLVLAVAWASKSSSPWLPEIESGVKIFFILCPECFLWHLFAGDYWSRLSSCVAFLAVSFTNDDFSKFKRKIEEMLDSLITCLLCGRKAFTVSVEF